MIRMRKDGVLNIELIAMEMMIGQKRKSTPSTQLSWTQMLSQYAQGCGQIPASVHHPSRHLPRVESAAALCSTPAPVPAPAPAPAPAPVPAPALALAPAVVNVRHRLQYGKQFANNAVKIGKHMLTRASRP